MDETFNANEECQADDGTVQAACGAYLACLPGQTAAAALTQE